MRIIRRQAVKPHISKLEQKFRRAWEFPPPGPYAPSVDLKHQCPMVAEHRFHPSRKWRFDFAWPSVKVAVEIQGGGFRRGKHTRGVGQQNDMDKLNEAQRLGWIVLQFGPAHLSSHRKARTVVRYVSEILSARANNVTQSGTKPTASPHHYVCTKCGSSHFCTVCSNCSGSLSNRPPKPPKPLRRTR